MQDNRTYSDHSVSILIGDKERILKSIIRQLFQGIYKEIKNSNGSIILEKGKVVDSDFVFKYYDTNGVVEVKGTSVRTGVSNYEYETRLNDEKRSIFILKPEFLQQFLNDFRDIMIYGRSSQKINDNLIKTENTNITTS